MVSCIWFMSHFNEVCFMMINKEVKLILVHFKNSCIFLFSKASLHFI